MIFELQDRYIKLDSIEYISDVCNIEDLAVADMTEYKFFFTIQINGCKHLFPYIIKDDAKTNRNLILKTWKQWEVGELDEQ